MDPADRDTELSLLLEQLDRRQDAGPIDPDTLGISHSDLGEEAQRLLEIQQALVSAARDWQQLMPAETASIADAADTGAETTDGDTTDSELEQPLPTSFGRYRVLRRLGRGGMGSVYEAHDPQLHRNVAIKVPLFPGPADRQKRARQRFVRESRAAAIIEHPNVCQIYDAGEQGDQPYVVMAFVPGESLADRLKRGRYDDPREAVQLIAATADALGAVHAHGIIHRDIKPGNILLQSSARAGLSAASTGNGSDGRPTGTGPFIPKLTDFGLARREEDLEALTADGTLVGTPAYMAPEQAGTDFGPVTPRSDIYGLGAVLYEMLTGRRPFEGTITQMLAQVVSKPVDPIQNRRPDIDPALAALVNRALAQNPQQRFASADEFAADLRSWLAGQPTITRDHEPVLTSPAATAPATSRPLKPLVLGLVILLVAVPVIGLGTAAVFWALASDGKPANNIAIGPGEPGKVTMTQVGPTSGPLKGDISVWIQKRENGKPDPNRPGELIFTTNKASLHDPGILPLKPGDYLQIDAKLKNGAEGYMYIVWLNTEGKFEPLFPWDEHWKIRPELNVPRTHLTLPGDVNPGTNVAPLGGGPRGIESLILLVRREPLPDDTVLQDLFAAVPPQNGLELGSAVWLENGTRVTDEGLERSSIKIDQAKASTDPVLRTQRLLSEKLKGLFPYSRAVCFSNAGDK